MLNYDMQPSKGTSLLEKVLPEVMDRGIMPSAIRHRTLKALDQVLASDFPAGLLSGEQSGVPDFRLRCSN
jgi:hypothetical protein